MRERLTAVFLPLQMHLSRCLPRGVHLNQVRNMLCIVVNKRKIQRDSVLIIRLITDKNIPTTTRLPIRKSSGLLVQRGGI
jgi:hypothetical protein